MMRSLYTAATGMMVQEQKMNVVANNLANSSTTGFKRARAESYLIISIATFAATVILTRLFLDITGYPQVGKLTPAEALTLHAEAAKAPIKRIDPSQTATAPPVPMPSAMSETRRASEPDDTPTANLTPL